MPRPKPPIVRISLAVLLVGLTLETNGQDGVPRRIDAKLPSGRAVAVALHRPVAALADAVRAGDSVIAATAAGGLLRFDRADPKLSAERYEDDAGSSVVRLGRGEGDSVLAGLADGRVGHVDPATLALTEIGRAPEAPTWIGWSPAAGGGKGGVVAIVGETVHDLASGRSLDTGDKVTACLVDREGRLWVGADKGEWGGRVARVDLRDLALVELPPPTRPEAERMADGRSFWSGIYGFVELRDGQVWACGGTSHMGSGEARIERVDELKPRTLYRSDQADDPDAAPRRDKPTMPITHLVEDGDGLLVLSYSDVFRVDGSLKVWKAADELSIRYQWGRRDAVGAYPAVRALLPPVRAGGPFVIATAGEGLVLLDGVKAVTHVTPGRLGASNVVRIEDSAEGLLFIEGDEFPAWKRDAGGWRAVDLAPPFEPDPDGDAPELERELTGWAQTHVLVGPSGVVSTVSESGLEPGTVVTAERRAGQSVRLGRETSSLYPPSTFITPDGVLWSDSDWLWRFSGGRWRRVAERPFHGGTYAPHALATKGPPWLLIDVREREGHADLWRLDPEGPGGKPRLRRLDLREGDAPREIQAAISRRDGLIQLATDAGFRTYDPAAGTLAGTDLPDPPEPVGMLARDGLGRLWCGGEGGLVLAVPGAKAVESFAEVPEIRKHPVTALAPDPAREDGVIASFGPRGVAFLSAAREP